MSRSFKSNIIASIFLYSSDFKQKQNNVQINILISYKIR